MKVLIVARCKNGRYAPFITEQVNALINAGIDCKYFGVEKNGYVKQIPALKRAIKDFNPDIIHAHYGLCGLFASLQHKVPVVTTYHGSDINNPKVLMFSRLAIKRSAFNIFVSTKNIQTAKPKGRFALIPCGINLEDYPDISKQDARKMMGLDRDKVYVLFAGAFDNPVKNAILAKEAVSLVKGAELLELKGYTRSEVSMLMHAADAFLMTSLSEGSPQVIKEALACNCPVVSVDVGDVSEQISSIEGCHITNYDSSVIAQCLEKVLKSGRRIEGRQQIGEKGLVNEKISEKITSIYYKVINGNY